VTEAVAAELLAAAVRLAIPILLAALGEVVVERAGVVNVGIEGMMLGGTLAAVLATLATGSLWLGLLAGAAAGVLGALPFALVAVHARADAIVTGTGINLLGLGLTGFVYQAAFGRTGRGLQVGTFAPVELGELARLPLVGRALFSQPAPAYLAAAAAVAVAFVLGRTGLGLRLRAAGEAPHAAEAAGSSVVGLRTAAVLVGGAFAGLGGATLALAHAGTFVEGMTAGRGFIALAVVICARWSAGGAVAASVLFGLALAFQFEIQALGLGLPHQLARMVPYLATIVVLIVTAGRGVRAPAALGRATGR
jgi:simple sugar transport system permease protein